MRYRPDFEELPMDVSLTPQHNTLPPQARLGQDQPFPRARSVRATPLLRARLVDGFQRFGMKGTPPTEFDTEPPAEKNWRTATANFFRAIGRWILGALHVITFGLFRKEPPTPADPEGIAQEDTSTVVQSGQKELKILNNAFVEALGIAVRQDDFNSSPECILFLRDSLPEALSSQQVAARLEQAKQKRDKIVFTPKKEAYAQVVQVLEALHAGLLENEKLAKLAPEHFTEQGFPTASTRLDTKDILLTVLGQATLAPGTPDELRMALEGYHHQILRPLGEDTTSDNARRVRGLIAHRNHLIDPNTDDMTALQSELDRLAEVLEADQNGTAQTIRIYDGMAGNQPLSHWILDKALYGTSPEKLCHRLLEVRLANRS